MNASAPKEAPIRILLATADAALRESRRALIESFGFHVSTSATETQALQLLQSDQFQLLILGHTLTSAECCKIAKAFRGRQPKGRVIEIARSMDSEPLNNPDAIVVGLDGPIALRETIEGQLRFVAAD